MFVQNARTISWNDSLMSAMLKNVPATPPPLAKTKMISSATIEDGGGPPHRDQGFLAPAGGDPTGGDELVLGQQPGPLPRLPERTDGGDPRHTG